MQPRPRARGDLGREPLALSRQGQPAGQRRSVEDQGAGAAALFADRSGLPGAAGGGDREEDFGGRHEGGDRAAAGREWAISTACSASRRRARRSKRSWRSKRRDRRVACRRGGIDCEAKTMSLAPLLNASPVIQLHAFAAMGAFALGIVQLSAPKGTIPHRTLGWIWACMMMIVAGSFAVDPRDQDVRLLQPHPSALDFHTDHCAACGLRRAPSRGPTPSLRDDRDLRRGLGDRRILHFCARSHHACSGVRQLSRSPRKMA